MRLLSLDSDSNIILREFNDLEVPPYAILSHTWLRDNSQEVSFQDVKDGAYRDKAGFAKIEVCAEQALDHGYNYSWIDTCCIDKSSSAELTEAINSMFKWYRNASVCYVYLEDIKINDETGLHATTLAQCRWFTRGWCLQELLAPDYVQFYDCDWNLIGDKKLLRGPICATAGISEGVIDGSTELHEVSVAEKMSWMAERTTTRVEDMAYSLLGIFDVNMPLLYGEGSKAFQRLQHEIIRQLDDHSIFTWSQLVEPRNNGLLARHPAAFGTCKDVEVVRSRSNNSPFSITNNGVSIQLLLEPWSVDTYIAVLPCCRKRARAAIFLRRLYQDHQYARVQMVGFGDTFWLPVDAMVGEGARLVNVNVRQESLSRRSVVDLGPRLNGFLLGPSLKDCHHMNESWVTYGPTVLETVSDRVTSMTMEPGSDLTNFGVFSLTGKKVDCFRLGFDFDFNPCVFFLENMGDLNDELSTISMIRRLKDRKALQARPVDDTNEWNAVEEYDWERLMATRSDVDLGKFRMFRGDRIHGLEVSLAGFGSVSSYGIATLKIKRLERHSPQPQRWTKVEAAPLPPLKELVQWTVDIEDLGCVEKRNTRLEMNQGRIATDLKR